MHLLPGDERRLLLEPDYAAKLFNADNHKRTNEIIFALAMMLPIPWHKAPHLPSAPRAFDNDDGMLGRFRRFATELPAGPSAAMIFSSRVYAGLCSETRTGKITPTLPDDYYAIDGDTKYNTTATAARRSSATTRRFPGWLLNKEQLDRRPAGKAVSDTRVNGAETDYPVFRLADVYLMLAEAVVRAAKAPRGDVAVGSGHLVRERATATIRAIFPTAR